MADKTINYNAELPKCIDPYSSTSFLLTTELHSRLKCFNLSWRLYTRMVKNLEYILSNGYPFHVRIFHEDRNKKNVLRRSNEIFMVKAERKFIFLTLDLYKENA